LAHYAPRRGPRQGALTQIEKPVTIYGAMFGKARRDCENKAKMEAL